MTGPCSLRWHGQGADPDLPAQSRRHRRRHLYGRLHLGRREWPVRPQKVWESNGGYCNSAAVMMDAGGGENGATGPSMTSTAIGIGIDDAWDGIRFATGTPQDEGVQNTARNVYMHTVRDDAMESDKNHGLTITDSLFEDVWWHLNGCRTYCS